MNTPMRRFLLWATCGCALWMGLCSLIGITAVEGALHTVRRPLGPRDRSLAEDIGARNHAVVRDVAMSADDGTLLRGWTLTPQDSNGDAVILLHGQGDNRVGMLGVADLLLRHGYAVLLPDSRAQGMSSGAVATYGVKEAADMRGWYVWLRHALNPRCIDALGDSMGAAIVLEATATVPQFCAAVAESSFSSFREAAYLRLGQEFGARPWFGRTLLFPAVETGFLYARLRYGVDFDRVSPARAAATSHVPILLIHGLADTNLPPYFSERIKANRPDAALWEPPGAGHCGAMETAPAEYERRVTSWFASHTRAGAVPLAAQVSKTVHAGMK